MRITNLWSRTPRRPLKKSLGCQSALSVRFHWNRRPTRSLVGGSRLNPTLDDKFSVFENYAAFSLLKFALVFMTGAVIFLYRERIPDSAWLALMCAGLYVGSLYWQGPSIHFTTSDILVPLVAYPLLWLGMHLPLHRIGARNDYSYGVYIYGFPVAQLLVIWGVEKWGLIPYTAMAILCTVPLAVASWWAIEKHALKLKSLWMPARAVSAPTTTSVVRILAQQETES